MIPNPHHYVLSMGAVFAMFAAWYYWIGKITGLAYPEVLGQIHFWMFFVGVNLTFFPMHFLGLAGMPRRIPDFPDAYSAWNLVASFGSYITSFAIVLFFVIVYITLTSNKVCPADPWGTTEIDGSSASLEWMLDSPPAFHCFDEVPRIYDVDTTMIAK